MDLNQDTLYIFTDGSCYPNPGPGGWAALMIYNGWCKLHYGGSDGETNNTMELRAILEGLKARTDPDVKTILYTDSQYCVNALTKWWKGWAKKGWITGAGNPVKNQPLIREILQYHDNVSFKWMKGHAGNCFNEAADMLARKGRAMVEDNPGYDPALEEIMGMISPFIPEPNAEVVPPFDPNDVEPSVEKVEPPPLFPEKSPGDLRDTLAGLYFMLQNKFYAPNEEHMLLEQAYGLADKFLSKKEDGK